MKPNRRARIVLLVWLLGVVNIVLIIVATLLFVLSRPRGGNEGADPYWAYIAETVARHASDKRTLTRELERLRAIDGIHAAARLPDGTSLGSTEAPPRFVHLMQARVTDGPVAGTVIEVGGRPPGPSGTVLLAFVTLVLALIGTTSFIAARWFVLPLTRLAEVAWALGSGNLSVRARMTRRDEFGDVADAFDEMAARIERLVASQRELIANVAHELRTPLARIQVALDLGEEGGPETARESLAEITEDLQELETLVDDVLTLARLEASPLPGSALPPLRKETVSLAALCDKAAAKFRVRHPDRDLHARLDALPDREVDPVLLRRALDNLLENAAKYSNAGTSIVMEARSTPEAVSFRIRDWGEGIAPRDLPYVFEPFFRGDRSRTRRGSRGFGLGLSLVKRIVEAHQGSVELSAAEGGGTLAVLSLPTPASQSLIVAQ